MKNYAGFLYGFDVQYLDHIAPLCCLLSIPFVVTEEEVAELALKFYPKINVHVCSRVQFAKEILDVYDVIFTCLPKQLVETLFFFDEYRKGKKIVSCWLPHGNSDKDNLDALLKDKYALIYGTQMLDRLKEKGVLSDDFKYEIVGNFRLSFYNENKLFYDNLLSNLSFKKTQKTLLFAPTWKETNVEENLKRILAQLPDYYNLFIKLHPNTLLYGFYNSLKEMYSLKSNILFLDDVPTIYPILDKTDVYIGDHSSIAYDFLHFNKRLIFLVENKSLIHGTGDLVSLDNLFDSLEREDKYAKDRLNIYNYAFEKSNKAHVFNQKIKNSLLSLV